MKRLAGATLSELIARPTTTRQRMLRACAQRQLVMQTWRQLLPASR